MIFNKADQVLRIEAMKIRKKIDFHYREAKKLEAGLAEVEARINKS